MANPEFHTSLALLFVRFSVGVVFLSEGIQKFLFPGQLGVGRFEKIGLPFPEFLGSFVGSFEVLCGTLVLLGLFTRLVALPLIIIILVAISTTKLPMLPDGGFWKLLHESRTDWAMLCGSLALAFAGAGHLSLDRKLHRL